ncbi:VOC family protein [Antribacter sp. KLBMP9083]|uniref:VOC family protein n=1 Tax=Antribacter soli TaxID=2910976 RepID=A0AA41QBE0_9MICO|nr:VOC family protein [Antribacter soli]MCF4120334.1 VOC family protein [Antribacter soli]
MSTTKTAPGVGKLDAVVLDVPDIRAAAAFWTGLTGARTEQDEGDDWLTLGTPDGWSVALQAAPDLVPPQWPGQEHPQQLHLDLQVPDLAAATVHAVELGATLLRENDEWNTLADPAGHPFDLCYAEGNPGTTIMGITLDCPDASALAQFWASLLGEPVVYDSDGIAMLGGDKPVLFQQVENYTPPDWPDPERPQQLHLDLLVRDLDAAEAAALELGATRLPGGSETFRVFADPAGHPFCLCR